MKKNTQETEQTCVDFQLISGYIIALIIKCVDNYQESLAGQDNAHQSNSSGEVCFMACTYSTKEHQHGTRQDIQTIFPLPEV